MGKIKAAGLFAFLIWVVYMHVNGYENRAHRNFEPLPQQSGIMEQEISPDQPLWFRNMEDSHSAIAEVTASKVRECGTGRCATVTVNMQNRAPFIIDHSDKYTVKLSPDKAQEEAGPFTVKWSANGLPSIVWNADELKRGIRTNQQQVTEAGVH